MVERSALLSGARTVSLVGNGPVTAAEAALVDRADVVVRMNRAPLCGVAGSRTDALALNIGLQMHVGTTGLPITRGARRHAREFWAHSHRHLGNEHDGIPVVAYGPEVMDRACEALVGHGGSSTAVPSLGAHTLQFLLDRSDAEIMLVGFTHQGDVDHHPWDAERDWMESLVGKGRVVRAPREGRLVRRSLLTVVDIQATRVFNHVRRLGF